MTSDTQVSRTRKLVVTALGIVTLLCVVLYFLSFLLGMWQAVAGVYDGPPILFWGVLFFTLPSAIICTVISLILVEPRGCKLAWISLCVFPLSIVVLIAIVLFAPDTKLH
jgi:hypothetical protein